MLWEHVAWVQFPAARLRAAEASLRRGEGPMRVSYIGITTGFQPVERGSTPLTRFINQNPPQCGGF